MTIEAQFAQIPTQATASDISQAETGEETPVLVGAWDAHRNFATRQPSSAAVEIEEEPTTSGRGIRQAVAARYAVYRVNHAFRRKQREFENVMDKIVHDPAGQSELRMSWSLRP